MKIKKPTLLVDRKKCEQNIETMAKKAANSNCIFRPHFKTHKSAVIAELYRNAGVSKITVSSVTMANYFASHGWNDITMAFPVNILEIDEINLLAENIHLGLLIESEETADFLNKNLKYQAAVYLKIDTGYGRTGIYSNESELIALLITQISESKNLNFSGFLTHSGQSYQAKSKAEILQIHQDTIRKMKELKGHFISKFSKLIISVGDTPTCSLADDFSELDEIRPGNFVYYDAMQLQLETCSFNQIAAVVACPVIAIHKDRQELIIYGGAVHLSKELLSTPNYGIIYGLIAQKNQTGWTEIQEGLYVKKLSQEHGTVHIPTHLLNEYKVGDLIYIVPVHSCLAANLLGEPLLIK